MDSLNVASYETAFYLTCLPVHTLRQMWLLQVCALCPFFCVYFSRFSL